MKIETLRGTYAETGTWYATTGQTGPLSGQVTIEHEATEIRFRYGDGSYAHTARFAPPVRTHAPLEGTGGSGTLYVVGDSLILEYAVEVNGRPERNTDIWTLTDGILRRRGIIRQPDRVIWYEATMLPVG